ncbi:serine/threonine exchange transporter, LAT family (TC 2.A.3.8.12) [Peptoclostridium litorale DSM 5388]|uniref:Serine/threonine exchanger SteT n=1 Tax=Peptoclostridium litorale DSM 5388 TaxID=1121324 RepID=A0A069RE77_PEPLI|nr:amino acid permease [Peptoclostridium litorale]KDR93952.1 serine/threonine exchanger SteT [Peptoclostridium litorale DSM 5388]KDR95379.1 serine/threonine exchanger SteT [Peptoclostridium litorale DSM 5388]SIN89226.1 serine/threonine exchange transporter, LAT family (TC 2.A.3.8.12) [Peptoclostridium litorale DSM 5388]
MNEELKKDLGFTTALSIVVGMVIGSGVFFKPTAIFGASGSAGLGILAWIIGGIITIAAGLTVAEISAAMPETGGMVVYIKKTYGDLWGFLLGWAQTTVYMPAFIAALAIIFATQAVSLMGISSFMTTPIAIGAILFLLVMNSVSSKAGGALQSIFTVAKLVPLIAIIVLGFIRGDVQSADLSNFTPGRGSLVSSLGSALIAVIFAFEGWINVGAIAGEMKNPGKDLPRAIVIGLSVVMSIYVLINIAYLCVLPADVLASTATPAADVANVIFGSLGGKVISTGILISIFGALNGFILTGMRIPYVMAKEGKLPYSNLIGKLHKKYETPVNSGILIVAISVIFTFTGKFDQLTDLLTFTIWIFYVMTFAAVMILRKKMPDMHRPYKVPLYPLLPCIGIAGGMYIIINTLLTQPMNASLGILITVLGLPVYMIAGEKMKKEKKPDVAA